nr:hypothetical protein [Tanacetum cinerariifolium]
MLLVSLEANVGAYGFWLFYNPNQKEGNEYGLALREFMSLGNVLSDNDVATENECKDGPFSNALIAEMEADMHGIMSKFGNRSHLGKQNHIWLIMTGCSLQQKDSVGTGERKELGAGTYGTVYHEDGEVRMFPLRVVLSRHYTLDEETYPRFQHKNRDDMDLFAFIHTPDPTKVKVVERERVKDEPLLLQTTIGRTVPLLLVMPDRADNELETSIDKMFDEGDSGSQAGKVDSMGVGEGTNVQPVTEATDIVTEDVAPLQPKRQRKRKIVVADAGGSSHPPQKLREDHGTPSRPSVAGKSRSAVQRSSVLVMTAVTTTTSMTDPVVVVKEKTAKPYLFAVDSSFAGRADPNAGVFWILPEVTSLSVDEVKALKESNASLKKERDALDVKVMRLEALAMGKDRELTDLNAQLTFTNSHNDSLVDQVHELEVASFGL